MIAKGFVFGSLCSSTCGSALKAKKAVSESFSDSWAIKFKKALSLDSGVFCAYH